MVTSTDWLNAGQSLFIKDGRKSLAISALCKKLDVTKGSFYHHFKSMDGYRVELEKFMKKKVKVYLHKRSRKP